MQKILSLPKNKRALLIATKNPGKFSEIKSFLYDLPVKIVSLDDLGTTEDVEEDGKTYEENSVKKALFYAKKTGLLTVADDGGIEIDALGGGPGSRSRRFFGKNGKEATDGEIIKKMKTIIKNFPQEKCGARFKTVITFALSNGYYFSRTGTVRGILKISPNLKLLAGYPYRSFFYLPRIKKYYHESELSDDEQKMYNHRYKAITKLKPSIKKELGL